MASWWDPRARRRVAGALLAALAVAALASCGAQSNEAGTRDVPQWVRSTFHGDGLTVSFAHPPSWRIRVAGRGFHYYDAFAYVANFGLDKYWCGNPENSGACTWSELGNYPPGGMLVSFGTGGYGPGAETQQQLLGSGKSLTIGRHRGRRRSGSGQGCLGIGADASVSYSMIDGKSQGIFGIAFCYRGPHLSSLQAEADRVARSIRLGPGPQNLGPGPDSS